MPNNFTEWDMKVSQWRGETLRALEDMNGDISEIKKELRDMNHKLTNLRIKNATLYGGLSLVVSLGTSLVILFLAGVMG